MESAIFLGEIATDTLGTAAASPRKGRREQPNLFGRPDLAAVYRRAKELIVKHSIFRIVQLQEVGDEGTRIVICNLWRIDRLRDGSVKTLEFDLNEERWHEVSELEYWPDVPLLPIKNTRSLDWWRQIASRAIWRALIAAGYRDCPSVVNPIPLRTSIAPPVRP